LLHVGPVGTWAAYRFTRPRLYGRGPTTGAVGHRTGARGAGPRPRPPAAATAAQAARAVRAARAAQGRPVAGRTADRGAGDGSEVGAQGPLDRPSADQGTVSATTYTLGRPGLDRLTTMSCEGSGSFRSRVRPDQAPG